ncbi:excisionase [Bifidobacterium catulorum]|uniref:Excisionase n=1 Tax=Bifidobacterium catulorum TaxID=1630173 RepID=A0A2U2MS54_9BIFI|nr:excisionase [Bifidobacterium catulorum]
MKDLPEISTPGDLARVSGISLGTLAYWRHSGTGPRYMKLGRLIRYRKNDVVVFFESSLRTSTAETA